MHPTTIVRSLRRSGVSFYLVVAVSLGITLGERGASAQTTPLIQSVETLTVGDTPADITSSPDGSRIYVANRSSGTVSVLDTLTNSTVATIPVGAFPERLAISPDGSSLYVTNIDVDPNNPGQTAPPSLSVIDTASSTVSATISLTGAPRSATVSPDGTIVYIVQSAANTVRIIDATTNTDTGVTIPTGGMGPNGLAITPNGTKLYVANFRSDTVSVLDASTHAVLKIIQLAADFAPDAVLMSQDASLIFVSGAGRNNAASTLAIIDTLTDTVLAVTPNNYAVRSIVQGRNLYLPETPGLDTTGNIIPSNRVAVLTIAAPSGGNVPAISVWGLAAMALLIITAGTIVYTKRHGRIATM